MYDNIVSCGCSMMYGSELLDRDNSRYISLIAKHYNSQLYDYSEPGLGNELIADYTISNISNLISSNRVDINNLLVVVKWTFLFRLNYYLKNTRSFLICNHNIHENYTNINTGVERYIDYALKVNKTDLTDVLFYYKNISDTYYPIYTASKAIHYTQSFLQSKNIKYVFLFGDKESYNLLFNINHEVKKVIDDFHNLPEYNFLLDDIKRSNFIQSPFIQYTQKNKFAVGKGGHPLEEAHLSYANFLIKEIDKKFNK